MADIWVPNPDTQILVPGATYRIRSTVRGDYSAFRVGLMRAQARFESLTRNLEYVSTDSAPPLMAAHSGTFAPWVFVFTFRPKVGSPSQAGMDPRALLALAAVIVAAALSLTLVESKIEKLVQTVGTEIRDTVETVPSVLPAPGILVLAFGALVVVFLMRRG